MLMQQSLQGFSALATIMSAWAIPKIQGKMLKHSDMKIKKKKKISINTRLVLCSLLAVPLLFVFSNSHQEYPPGTWDTIIENQDFTAPLKLERGDNNVLIINSTFHNIKEDAITLRNVSNVYIKNCRIFNIDGNGIVLRSTGETSKVTIDGCTIHDTTRNGIIAKQDAPKGINHTQLIIKNNTLYHNGSNDLDHSIYVQSQDSLIQNNEIHETTGNGISIRSSGILRSNKIWDTDKSCIRYFNDNQTGPSNTLLIENNTCYQTIKPTAEDSQTPGISLLGWDEALPESTVGNYIIRFNTVIMFTKERTGIDVESSQYGPKRVVVYGNIVINTEDIDATIRNDHIDYLSRNYISTTTEGFVNLKTKPFDLHLTEISPALDFANNEIGFPRTDADGQTRSFSHLDAGAYQFERIAESSQSGLPEGAQSDRPENIERTKKITLTITIGIIILLLSAGLLIYLKEQAKK